MESMIHTEFSLCTSKEAIYLKIMEWGKKLPPFDPAWKTDENRVTGCQSLMYLHSSYSEGHLQFFADSDALISKGLAALLISYYEGKTPEFILKNQPIFLEELGILESLTPGRANGVASLYQKMREKAVLAVVSN
jgi:cysteine desulfuration protein SufE